MLCEGCGKNFEPKKFNGRNRFCSKRCRNAYDLRTDVNLQPLYPGLERGRVGAVGELRAATDLTIKGYDVFRAVSQSSSCDLVAIKGSKVLRIEVKVARKTKSGKPLFAHYDSCKSDHLAAVFADEIAYIPALDGDSDVGN